MAQPASVDWFVPTGVVVHRLEMFVVCDRLTRGHITGAGLTVALPMDRQETIGVVSCFASSRVSTPFCAVEGVRFGINLLRVRSW